jgi:hypothetical protein
MKTKEHLMQPYETILRAVAASLLFILPAAAGVIHPFVPQSAGTSWSYSFHISSSSQNMFPMISTQESSKGTFTVHLVNKDSITVAIHQTHSLVKYSSLDTSGTIDSTSTMDSTYTVRSLEDAMLVTLLGWYNPFTVDSVFRQDTASSKLDSVSGVPCGADTFAFAKAKIGSETVLSHRIAHYYNMTAFDAGWGYSGTIFLDHIGAVKMIQQSSGAAITPRGSSVSIILDSLNGKPIDPSSLQILQPVSMLEMEKLYPQYAVHASGISSKPVTAGKNVSLFPRFHLQKQSDGTMITFAAPADFSLEIFNVCGKTISVYKGHGGRQSLRVDGNGYTQGIYIFKYETPNSVQTKSFLLR